MKAKNSLISWLGNKIHCDQTLLKLYFQVFGKLFCMLGTLCCNLNTSLRATYWICEKGSFSFSESCDDVIYMHALNFQEC